MATLIKRSQEVAMNIGQAAAASGVSAKMLRYYESIDLIPPASRTQAGYRTYSDRDVDTLRFIRRARDFGMPMDRVKLLVGLWQDNTRPSREVKQIALTQVAELEARIAELTAMKDALADLAQSCHGDDRPDCPILRDIEGQTQTKAHLPPAGQGRKKPPFGPGVH
jgi:MerR family transcriptional regulator, copper efflux regulator